MGYAKISEKEQRYSWKAFTEELKKDNISVTSGEETNLFGAFSYLIFSDASGTNVRISNHYNGTDNLDKTDLYNLYTSIEFECWLRAEENSGKEHDLCVKLAALSDEMASAIQTEEKPKKPVKDAYER